MPDLTFRKVFTESTAYALTRRASDCELSESEDLGPDSSDHEETSSKSATNEESMSVGSALHGTGQCKPCAWFWKPQSCANGRDCLHCHLCPNTAIKTRKKLMLAYKKESELRREPAGLDALSSPQASSAITNPTLLGSSRSLQGSALHGTGECKPCAWVWHEKGCKNGKDCEYCHLCPQGELKVRRKQKLQVLRGVSSEQPEAEEECPSVGSAAHESGACRPCAWFWKPEGCKNGKECKHCHLCPEGELRRKRTEKRHSFSQATPWVQPGKAFRSKLHFQAMLIEQQQQQLAHLQMQIHFQAMASTSAMLAAASLSLNPAEVSEPECSDQLWAPLEDVLPS
mmetsp:Transcript_18169/g.31899  ORF Transcript_18169/g.31899 Transcript_18169/m.31899 type:complete len:342 (-) Transcript_18169:75-1100(-)